MKAMTKITPVLSRVKDKFLIILTGLNYWELRRFQSRIINYRKTSRLHKNNWVNTISKDT